jgi:hypothetical protein
MPDLDAESEELIDGCRYCGGSGWYYGTVSLGPCGCQPDMFRVGHRIRRNVYGGDKPFFMAADEYEAEMLVSLLNAGLRMKINGREDASGTAPGSRAPEGSSAQDGEEKVR